MKGRGRGRGVIYIVILSFVWRNREETWRFAVIVAWVEAVIRTRDFLKWSKIATNPTATFCKYFYFGNTKILMSVSVL
jgi:hypothetical protein